MELTSRRVEQFVAIAVFGLLVAGCLLVLAPFVAPILWALILALTTWPAFRRLREAVGGRRTLAAGLMTLLLILVVLVPLALLSVNVVGDAAEVVRRTRQLLAEGVPHAPDWLAGLPVVGHALAGLWQGLAEGTLAIGQHVPKVIRPVGAWLVSVGAGVGRGMFDLSISLLVLFFLYRDGRAAGEAFTHMARRVVGEQSLQLIGVAENTLKGVVYGVVGTAFAQGVLMALGLWFAGVPGATFLGVVAGLASLIPVGAAIVWIPAALWLVTQGEIGWGLFVAAWGAAIVGSADNFIKPMFISRGSNLPFIVVFLGVIGGMMAFGFLGLFLGPTLLALGFTLLGAWAGELARADETPRDEALPEAGSEDG